jgi:hypothetical protein
MSGQAGLMYLKHYIKVIMQGIKKNRKGKNEIAELIWSRFLMEQPLYHSKNPLFQARQAESMPSGHISSIVL